MQFNITTRTRDTLEAWIVEASLKSDQIPVFANISENWDLTPAMVLATGCVSPRMKGRSATADIKSQNQNLEVVNVENDATRPTFKEATEEWLSNNHYSYTVVPQNTDPDVDKLALKYIGYWNWDLALFMRSASIAFYQGESVGKATYKARNNMSMAKYGSARKKIGQMLNIVFGKVAAPEK